MKCIPAVNSVNKTNRNRYNSVETVIVAHPVYVFNNFHILVFYFKKNYCGEGGF
ncbi:unnamed protein product [Tenebrio molitor]|nr:unnamed protein product [Tenebrio molitor]